VILLLCCIMAPTIWSMSAYPEKRGLLTGVYVLILFLFFLGAWAAAAGRKLSNTTLSPKIHLGVGIVFTVLIGIYLLRLFPSMAQMIGAYQKRAELWDARNAQILEMRAQGLTDLVVPGITSIGGILELQPKTGYVWVNHCAATYYGVKSIFTTE
jgi:hypothetical protein